MNIKSTWRVFGFFSPAEYIRCHVHVCVLPKRRRSLGGVVNVLPFIIKHILGIKRIFPYSFGNKHMRLLTRVYGSISLQGNDSIVAADRMNKGYV